MSPSEIATLNSMEFVTLNQIFSIFSVFYLEGRLPRLPQTPPGALYPTGDGTHFCPLPKQIPGYAPGGGYALPTLIPRGLCHYTHPPLNVHVYNVSFSVYIASYLM